jgi:hypothetical protein
VAWAKLAPEPVTELNDWRGWLSDHLSRRPGHALRHAGARTHVWRGSVANRRYVVELGRGIANVADTVNPRHWPRAKLRLSRALQRLSRAHGELDLSAVSGGDKGKSEDDTLDH